MLTHKAYTEGSTAMDTSIVKHTKTAAQPCALPQYNRGGCAHSHPPQNLVQVLAKNTSNASK